MKTALSLSAILLFLASHPVIGEEKPNRDRDPWNGFGVGSWAVTSESNTKDGKTETTREKETRVESKTRGAIVLSARREGKTPGVFDGEESTRYHIPGLDPALDPECKLLKTGKEEVVIQGKKYACEVKTYDLTRNENKATAIYWYCADVKVPYREFGVEPRTLALRPNVVRVDVEFQSKKRTAKSSLRVVSFNEEVKVGTRKVTCVREEATIEMSEGGTQSKGTGRTLLSAEVPGNEVEVLAEGEFGGSKFKTLKRIEAFEVVKEK
jgi:hypothetical protein